MFYKMKSMLYLGQRNLRPVSHTAGSASRFQHDAETVLSGTWKGVLCVSTPTTHPNKGPRQQVCYDEVIRFYQTTREIRANIHSRKSRQLTWGTMAGAAPESHSCNSPVSIADGDISLWLHNGNAFKVSCRLGAEPSLTSSKIMNIWGWKLSLTLSLKKTAPTCDRTQDL